MTKMTIAEYKWLVATIDRMARIRDACRAEGDEATAEKAEEERRDARRQLEAHGLERGWVW